MPVKLICGGENKFSILVHPVWHAYLGQRNCTALVVQRSYGSVLYLPFLFLSLSLPSSPPNAVNWGLFRALVISCVIIARFSTRGARREPSVS